MGQYLLEQDAVNGKAGKGFVTINGENREIFSFINLQVQGSFDEADFKVVGTRVVQKKTTGVQLTGSMTLYYGDPMFMEMVEKYVKEGKVTYFTLQITNDDPNTTIGKQVVALYNVKFSSGDLIKLDANSEWLDQSLSFSFNSFETLENFKKPTVYGGKPDA